MPKIQLQRYLETSTKRVGVDSSPIKQGAHSQHPGHGRSGTYVIAIKLDGVQCALVTEIIKHFEHKRFHLMAMKLLWASEELLKQHSIDLKDHPFFPGLVKYMSSRPVGAMVWEGLNVVKTRRATFGETNSADSKAGTN